MMKFRGDFIVFAALARAVELGLATAEDIAQALADTRPPLLSPARTADSVKIERQLHFSALLWERKLLAAERWHELQPAALALLDDDDVWSYRSSVLITLMRTIEAEYLPAVLEKVLARASHHYYDSRKWVSLFASRIPAEAWEGVMEMILQMPVTWQRNERADALEIIAPVVPDALVSRVFAEAMQMEEEGNRNPRLIVIQALAARLNDAEFRQALDYLRHLRNTKPEFRAYEVMTPVLERMSAAERTQEMNSIVPWVLERKYLDVFIVRSIAPFLEEDNLRRIQEAALEEPYIETQCCCLIALFPRLDNQERLRLVGYVLDRMPSIGAGTPDTIPEEHQLHVLHPLAPYLHDSPSSLARAVEIVQKNFASPLQRSYALAYLAETAPEPMRTDLLETALKAVLPYSMAHHTFIMGDQRGLINLIPQFNERLLNRAFEAMITPPDETTMGIPRDVEDKEWRRYMAVFEQGQIEALNAMNDRLSREQISRVLERMEDDVKTHRIS